VPGLKPGRSSLMTDVVVRGLVRETIDTGTGALQVQGLVREVIGSPGVGTNRLLVQGLVREVLRLGGTGAGPATARQYAVSVT